MKKLLGLETPKEFWSVFSQERIKIIKKQRKMPFLEKLKILEKMDKLIIKPQRQITKRLFLKEAGNRGVFKKGTKES